MTETFTWQVTAESPSAAVTFSVRTAKFGDGYEQASPDGINNKISEWSVTYVGHRILDGLADIESFLDRHAGATSFLWTPPNGTEGLFRCAKYNLTDLTEGWQSIEATFTQSYQP